MKKVLTLIFTALIAVASVRAEEPVSATPLHIGDNAVAINNPTTNAEWQISMDPSHYILFSYTVWADGIVTITSEGDEDTFGVLYDKDMKLIDSNDDRDDDDDSNFGFTFDAKAGEVYYIGVRGYYDYVGSYTIYVSAPVLEACEVGHHTMNHVDEIPATCTEDGTKSYYECSTCLLKFSDTEGAEEVADLTIPALGHNIVDSRCTREGCGFTFSATPLHIGDNVVAITSPTTVDEWNLSLDPSHYTLFSYTVLVDGKVTISSVGDKDTYGVLYDKDMKFIDSNDDGDDSNFGVTFDAKAGEVCYIGARGYYGSVGRYIIHVSAPVPEACEVGHHTMNHVDEIPATCTVQGVESYYECSVCHHRYSDAKGAEEIDKTNIPALGHHIEGDGCIHEGCSLNASNNVLYNGDNSVVINNPTAGYEWDDDRGNYVHYTLFKYIAPGNGNVTIFTVGEMDTYGAVYDKNWKLIDRSDGWDDEDDGLRFKVKAGDVYYIGARGYQDTEIGNYTIHVDGPLVPCEVGQHDMNHVEALPVTCTTAGIKSYYECSICHYKYSDVEGTKMIDKTNIPALGHHIEGDRCTHEGCSLDVSNSVLYNGGNSVFISNPTSGLEWDNDVSNNAHYTLFKYTVLADGDVTIYSDLDGGTYAVLYDKNWILQDQSNAWDDDYEKGFHFKVKAGDVYYIGVRGYDDNEIGDYTIYVDGPLVPCEKGQHDMNHVEACPATCTTTGIKSHYECSICLHKYSDAEGVEEIYETVIPALGHHMVDDKCTHEGCDYVVSATPLTVGDNSVDISNPTSGDEWDSNRDNPSHYTLFKFTAQVDGGVAIYADGDLDSYGVLFDKGMNLISTSDDDYDRNFKFTTDIKAGEVYYIGARGWRDKEIGSYTIVVEELTTFEAAIGSRNYHNILSALRDIEDGETLTLLDNINIKDGLLISDDITLDLNGNTLYGWITNRGHLTIEDSSKGKTGRIETSEEFSLLDNDRYNTSITINGGTFVGGTITDEYGVFYINAGTFILPVNSDYGYTIKRSHRIVFGDGVVYRDLSGEYDDISNITDDVTYSGEFVKVNNQTAIERINAPAKKGIKAIKTIQNGRIVIIRGSDKYDLSGRKL